MKIKQVVEYYISSLSRLYDVREAENITFWVLEDKLALSKASLKVHGDELISEVKANELVAIVLRLQKGEPVQYVLGYADFFGMQFKVNPAVLIPRPETEELVDWIIKDNRERNALRILDIGTGSGCIAIALKKNIPQAEVFAMDISTEALNVAEENAFLNHTTVQFSQGDILNDTNAFLSYDYNIIVSNPPYVTLSEGRQMHPNVLNYEPHLALFVPDEDPLMFYKAISVSGMKYLSQGGSLYLEVNENLASEVVVLLNNDGYQEIAEARDLSGKNRLVKAFR